MLLRGHYKDCLELPYELNRGRRRGMIKALACSVGECAEIYPAKVLTNFGQVGNQIGLLKTPSNSPKLAISWVRYDVVKYNPSFVDLE